MIGAIIFGFIGFIILIQVLSSIAFFYIGGAILAIWAAKYVFGFLYFLIGGALNMLFHITLFFVVLIRDEKGKISHLPKYLKIRWQAYKKNWDESIEREKEKRAFSRGEKDGYNLDNNRDYEYGRYASHYNKGYEKGAWASDLKRMYTDL